MVIEHKLCCFYYNTCPSKISSIRQYFTPSSSSLFCSLSSNKPCSVGLFNIFFAGGSEPDASSIKQLFMPSLSSLFRSLSSKKPCSVGPFNLFFWQEAQSLILQALLYQSWLMTDSSVIQDSPVFLQTISAWSVAPWFQVLDSKDRCNNKAKCDMRLLWMQYLTPQQLQSLAA